MTEDDYKTQQMNNAVAANKVLKAYVGEPPKMEQVVFKTTPPSDLDAIADALEFYANKENYKSQFVTEECGCCSYEHDPVMDDGEKARSALAIVNRLRTGKAEGG